MAHDPSSTGPFWAIKVGGGHVPPAPDIPTSFEDTNLLVRGEFDRTFKWRNVTAPHVIPFGLDFFTPDAYQLEITPDLGWPNPEDMFESYIRGSKIVGNARLIVHTNLVPGEELVQAVDELEFTLSDDQWLKLVSPPFQRYLWRVRAQGSPAGFPSDIQSFRLLDDIPEINWTIDPLPDPVGLTQSISGTRVPDITIIEVMNHSPQVSLPTPNTWSLEIPLSKAETGLFVRAKAGTNATSAYRSVSTTLVTTVTQPHGMWNTFDELGSMFTHGRFEDESNIDYKIRILDTGLHRANWHYEGVRNYLTRDLGFLSQQRDQAVVVTRALDLFRDENPETAVRITIGPRTFRVAGRVFRVKKEQQVVNGRTWRLRLAKKIQDAEPIVEIPEGNPIKRTDYTVDTVTNDLVFKEQYRGKKAWVSYFYQEEIVLLDLTLDQLKTAVEAIQIDANQVLNFTVESGAGSLGAEELEKISPVEVMNIRRRDAGGVFIKGVPLRWSPVQVFAMQDKEFLARFTNEWGNLFGTKVESWKEQLLRLMKDTWGFLVADRAIWHTEEQSEQRAFLPTTMDIPRGFWRCSKLSHTDRYDIHEFIDLNGKCPEDGSDLIFVGAPVSFYHSGVGFGNALLVTIREQDATFEETEKIPSVVQLLSTSLGSLSDTGPSGSGVFDPDAEGLVS